MAIAVLSGCSKNGEQTGYTPDKIVLNQTEIELYVGEVFQLKARVSPSVTAQPTYNWTSSDPSVVSVSAGKLTALKEGKSEITASALGKSATAAVTVKVPEAYEPWGETGMNGDRYAYLANDKVQIGVDLSRGGGIFHFSTAAEKVNHLNHADEGRFIQQSYYGNDGQAYKWSSNDWTWNPIQGGGSDGQPAVVKSWELTSNSLTVVTTPRQWGRLASTGKCPLAEDCEMKEVLKTKDNYVVMDFTFKYVGSKELGTASQELPAFFCDWNFNNFVIYKGGSPWKNQALTYITPIPLSGIANENPACNAAEEWFAYVNDDGYGIGLYTPGTKAAVYYTFGSGPGGAASGSCSYFAPIRSINITPNFKLNYQAYITIGTIDEIRATFKSIHDSL